MSEHIIEYVINGAVGLAVLIGAKIITDRLDRKIETVHKLVNSAATEQARVIAELNERLRAQGETLLAERTANAAGQSAVMVASLTQPPATPAEEKP